MLKISSTRLEEVRKNPSAINDIVSTVIKRKDIGMFAKTQNAICKVHNGKLSIAEARESIENQFLVYKESTSNRKRQNLLLMGFDSYFHQLDTIGLSYEDGRHFIQWKMHPNVSLSGLTPFVANKDGLHYAYIIAESIHDWEKELRFPLFQKYLSEETISCSTKLINVGVYSMSTGLFEFKQYNLRQINAAESETKDVFKDVYNEYLKGKK